MIVSRLNDNQRVNAFLGVRKHFHIVPIKVYKKDIPLKYDILCTDMSAGIIKRHDVAETRGETASVYTCITNKTQNSRHSHPEHRTRLITATVQLCCSGAVRLCGICCGSLFASGGRSSSGGGGVGGSRGGRGSGGGVCISRIRIKI